MDVKPTSLPDCVELFPRVIEDDRGLFVKAFHRSTFRDLGLETEVDEYCCSRSTKGVVRGLHFQLPPVDQAKIVYCVSGEVLDVVVDLRRGSPTYGGFEVIPLDDRRWHGVFVPRGFAHGFAAVSDVAVIGYLLSGEFDPELDSGIRWDSLPIPWPVSDPILSPKDRELPLFADFDSPWVYEARP